ncbi:MAG: DedA family protein [Elusimicrobiota bacterium]|nr:DedA family protein [Elusimicrobiota bacterium]
MSGGLLIKFILLFSSFAYIGVFILLILSGCGFPLPEEITLLAAGFLTSQAIAHIAPMFFFCFIGAFISDMVPYFAGYFYGPRILSSKYAEIVVNRRRMRKISLFFKIYGYKKVFIMRPFFLGIRPFIMLFAGISGIEIKTFLPYQLTGMAAGVLFWLSVGRLFASKIAVLTVFFYHSKNTIILSVLIAGAAYLLCRFVFNIKIKARFFARALSYIFTALFLALMGYEVYVYRSSIRKLFKKPALTGYELKTPLRAEEQTNDR